MGTYPPLPKRPYCTSSWENAQSLSFCSKLRQCIAAEPLFWDLPPNLLLQYPRTTQGLALHLAPPLAATLAAPRPRRPLPALTCWRALTLPHTPTPTHCTARGCGRPWLAWTLSLSMTPCCSRGMCSAPHPLFANLNSAARSDLGCASSAMLLALTHLLPASAQKTPHVLGSFGFSSRACCFSAPPERTECRNRSFSRGSLLSFGATGNPCSAQQSPGPAPPPDPPPTPLTLMICRVGLSAPPA